MLYCALFVIVSFLLLEFRQNTVPRRYVNIFLKYVKKIQTAINASAIMIIFAQTLNKHFNCKGIIVFIENDKIAKRISVGMKLRPLQKVNLHKNTFCSISPHIVTRLGASYVAKYNYQLYLPYSSHHQCYFFCLHDYQLPHRVQILVELLRKYTVLFLRASLLETRNKSFSKELGNIEDAFSQVIKNSPNSFIVTDKNMKILYANDMFLNLTGYTSKKIQNINFTSFFPDFKKLITNIVRQINTNQLLVDYIPELKVSFKKQQYYLDLTCYPINSSNNKVLFLVFVIRDQTSQVELSRELRSAQELSTRQLNEKVDLATKELIVSNKELQRAVELKSEFVSTITHELRTPLTSLKGFLSLLANEKLGKLNKKQMESIVILKEETDRLSLLINDILDFSKLEAGKSSLQISQIDLTEMIISVQKTLKAELDQKKIKCLISGQSVLAFVDAEKMRRVFMNLLNNAIKYSPSKTTITIELHKTEHKIIIIFQDQGYGIPQENLPHIFDAFYTVRSQMTMPIKGTGLGLAIVKHILSLHNATISVKSTVNKGTTFTIELPILTAINQKQTA